MRPMPTSPAQAAAEPPTGPSPALVHDISSMRHGGFGSVTLGEGADAVQYEILHKPSMLMLSEMARVESGSEVAAATLAEFFECTLGDDGYRAFKTQLYRQHIDDDEMMRCMWEIVEQAMGRPTE